MFVKEIQLFKNLDPGFINELADLVEEVSFPEKHVVVRQGEEADRLYVLVEGQINLSISRGGSINFMIDTPGEIFGWSALVDPNVYTASAECYQETKLLVIDRVRMEHVLDKHPKEAYRVMKRLAGVIGGRLANSYQENLRSGADEKTPSYG